MKLTLAIGLVMCGVLAAADDAPKESRKWPRVRLGGVIVSAGYSHFSGGYPYFYRYPFGYYPGFWGAGAFYDPFLFSPYLHPGYFTGFGYHEATGELKLRNVDPGAWVYLDGALAGQAGKLKTMWLEPGAYEIELRTGPVRTGRKIYMLSGKTLSLSPGMLEARQ
jgi:hypothetical protein